MESNNNLLELEESMHESIQESFSSKICRYLGMFFSGVFSLGLLSYIICAIAFLISDYHLSSLYYNCYLWGYILCYLCLILVKLCLLKYESCVFSIKFCNCLIMLLIDLGFFIFGYTQMGLTNTTCNELHGSNLWYIGVCSLIIQTIISCIYSYFLLVFIYVEICKIKTPCCCSK